MQFNSYGSVFAPGLFRERTVIVTGAGSGIGRCTAHELASLGAHVVLIGRTLAKLEKVAAEISAFSKETTSLVCDIRDATAVHDIVGEVLHRRGAIHGLVNNAGGQYPSRLQDISLKGWDAVIRTNLTGGFIFATEVYRQFMEKHGGSIVNIVADYTQGMPNMGHSGASRAGMVNFTETAAFEWASHGTRVNAVMPGYVLSSGMDTYDEKTMEKFRHTVAQLPFKRMATESEISAAIVFLLSPAAAYVSGATLVVNGAGGNLRQAWTADAGPPAEEFNGFRMNPSPPTQTA